MPSTTPTAWSPARATEPGDGNGSSRPTVMWDGVTDVGQVAERSADLHGNANARADVGGPRDSQAQRAVVERNGPVGMKVCPDQYPGRMNESVHDKLIGAVGICASIWPESIESATLVHSVGE
jgi:hypothetical protein